MIIKGNWIPPNKILPGIYINFIGSGSGKEPATDDKEDSPSAGHYWLTDIKKLRLKTADGFYLVVKL